MSGAERIIQFFPRVGKNDWSGAEPSNSFCGSGKMTGAERNHPIFYLRPALREEERRALRRDCRLFFLDFCFLEVGSLRRFVFIPP